MAKFLFKANDDVLSHCNCQGEPAMSPGQLDCPWCGCGWLICCSKCLKAFTYAVVQETKIPLVELGRREAQARGLRDLTEQDIQDWAKGMGDDLDRFEIGQIVVYLDGEYLSIDAKNISFEGYFAKHSFSTLPHAAALTRPAALRECLGEASYWIDRELPDRHTD